MKILIAMVICLLVIVVSDFAKNDKIKYQSEAVLCRINSNNRVEEIAHFRTNLSLINCNEVRSRYTDYEKDKSSFTCYSNSKCELK